MSTSEKKLVSCWKANINMILPVESSRMSSHLLSVEEVEDLAMIMRDLNTKQLKRNKQRLRAAFTTSGICKYKA